MTTPEARTFLEIIATNLLGDSVSEKDEKLRELMLKEYDAMDIAIKALEKQVVFLNLLVDFESDYICEKLCVTDWCEEHCKYACPQKECYLKYAEIRLE